MRTAAVAAPEPGGHHDVVRGLHPGRHRRRQAAEFGLRRVCVRYGRPERGGGAERRVSASPALTRRPRPPGPALPCPALWAASGGRSWSGPVPSARGRRTEPKRGTSPARRVRGPARPSPRPLLRQLRCAPWRALIRAVSARAVAARRASGPGSAGRC